MNRWLFLLLLWSCLSACYAQIDVVEQPQSPAIQVGAEWEALYMAPIKGKKVAVVANATSMLRDLHLVDALLQKGIHVTKVFAPEHGFRGDVPAGEKVNSTIDEKTGIPIVSLYGKHFQPTEEDLNDVEIVLFDIQDVGVRFYTYLSTMYYVMQACEKDGVEMIVLDRPNPNASAIDGPILDLSLKSMVGVLPIPILHGCTLGELALMMVGEEWGVSKKFASKLTVVPIQNWNHQQSYSLPIPPSPNLRSDCAIHLYPSLCWFEGTSVSVGRGTEMAFETFGFPALKNPDFHFTPQTIAGRVNHPPYDGQECGGRDIKKSCQGMAEINLHFLMEAYANLGDDMFTSPSFFDKLAGTTVLRQQLKDHLPEVQIRLSWQPGLEQYKAIRSKYLLYP